MKNGLIKPTEIRNVCVYCGSGTGRNPKFAQAARELGRIFAQNNIRLIYGGGALGLMGEIARATIENGGQVTGIIPDFLIQREKMLREVQEVIVTDTMHERKQLMFERSDGFVALPGGAGTLDELIEQITWSQLGQHKKPVVIANIENYWDGLLALIEHMRAEAFIRSGLEVNFRVTSDIHQVVPILQQAANRMTTHFAPAEIAPEQF